MAEAKKKRVIKKSETVREKATKSAEVTEKPKRLHKVRSAVKRPVGAVKRVGGKEYHPVKLPDNKTGKFMTKSRRITPRYFRDAWGELKLVTWPNRKETTKLTVAVIVFAVAFGTLIAVVDYGLDKVFKALLLN